MACAEPCFDRFNVDKQSDWIRNSNSKLAAAKEKKRKSFVCTNFSTTTNGRRFGELAT